MRFNGDGTFTRRADPAAADSTGPVSLVSVRIVDWFLMTMSALALFGTVMSIIWAMTSNGILSGGTNPSVTGHGPIIDLLCAALAAPLAALATGRFRSELWVNEGGIFWSHRGRQGHMPWRSLSGVYVHEREGFGSGLFPTLHYVFEDGLRRPMCPVDVGGIDRAQFNAAFRQKGLLVTDAGEETPGPGVLTIFAILVSLASLASGWVLTLFVV